MSERDTTDIASTADATSRLEASEDDVRKWERSGKRLSRLAKHPQIMGDDAKPMSHKDKSKITKRKESQVGPSEDADAEGQAGDNERSQAMHDPHPWIKGRPLNMPSFRH
jgi:hypothetical protein